MVLQKLFINRLCKRVYRGWKDMAVLRGKLPAEYAVARYDTVRHQPKRWPWVDIKGESAANAEKLANKLTSRTRLAAEQGEDIEDIFDELADEEALAAEKGVDLEPPQAAAQPAQSSAPSKPDEEDDAPEQDEGRDAARVRRVA
jgi:capsid protein